MTTYDTSCVLTYLNLPHAYANEHNGDDSPKDLIPRFPFLICLCMICIKWMHMWAVVFVHVYLPACYSLRNISCIWTKFGKNVI